MATASASSGGRGLLFAMMATGMVSALIANSPKIYSNIKNHWKRAKDWSDGESGNVWLVGGLGLLIVHHGLIYDKLGTFGILLFGTVVCVSGFLLKAIFIPTGVSPWVHGFFELLDINGGLGLIFGAVWTISKACPANLAGVVCGVLLATYSIGAITMTTLWQVFYGGKAHTIADEIADLKDQGAGADAILAKRNELAKHVAGYVWMWTIAVAVGSTIFTILLPILYNRYAQAKKAESPAQLEREAGQRRKTTLATAPPEPLWQTFGQLKAYFPLAVYLLGIGQAWPSARLSRRWWRPTIRDMGKLPIAPTWLSKSTSSRRWLVA
mmetsp:Transcript_37591/g.94292  ORF Transcript_37591/g.94292 Transcript_37591/m.94292 type:complete len:325 (+) Transcript_37591:135-1109(+)